MIYEFKYGQIWNIHLHFSDVSRMFGRPIYWFGRPDSGAQKTLVEFSFIRCTSKKIWWIEINDFTMHLINSKFLRRRKSRHERKTMRQKDVEAKEELQWKCFHSSKYVIDHANVRFFFLISLRACSHSSQDVTSLQCFIWFLLHYFLRLFSSDSFLTSL